MLKTFLAKAGAIALAPLLALTAAPAVSAQTVTNDEEPSVAVCTELEHTLYWGTRDRRTDGEVSELQAFLKAEGYLGKNGPSGFFGMATFNAVREFQRDHDIRATGFVGEATREAIEDESCGDANEDLAITSIDAPAALAVNEEGTWTVNVNTDPDAGGLKYSVKWGDEGFMARLMSMDEDIQTDASFTHAYGEAGTYTPEFTVTDADGNTVSKSAAQVVVSDEAEAAPAITAISASEAAAGAKLTLTGTNFTEDSRVFVGSTEADATFVSDSSLTFSVPAIALGDYSVTVKNGDQTSNGIGLEIIKKLATRVSISGIDAPVTLAVNEEGTWTVNVDTNASGNLKYAVEWGDEGIMARMMGSSEVVQTSSTFTHSYSDAGTYKPKFTVTDESGARSSVSATVVVTD